MNGFETVCGKSVASKQASCVCVCVCVCVHSGSTQQLGVSMYGNLKNTTSINRIHKVLECGESHMKCCEYINN